MTRGEHPTVFSLKSRRSLPARPAVGGEYGFMPRTAGRGLMAPLGSLGDLAAIQSNLHGACVRLQTFGARQGGDGGSEAAQGRLRQLLHRDHLEVIGHGEPAALARHAAGGEHVVWTRDVIAGGFGTERSNEDAAGVPDLGKEALLGDAEMLGREAIGYFDGFVERR